MFKVDVQSLVFIVKENPLSNYYYSIHKKTQFLMREKIPTWSLNLQLLGQASYIQSSCEAVLHIKITQAHAHPHTH